MIKKIIVISIIYLCALELFAQKIDVSRSEYVLSRTENKDDTIYNIKYTITDTIAERLIILFSKKDITTIPTEKAVFRSILTYHNDFQLSMMAWESHVFVPENCIQAIPYHFVKIMNPNDSFEIIFQAKGKSCQISNLGLNHIIMLPESYFITNTRGLDNFVRSIEEYHYEFKYDYIIMDCEDFLKYIKSKF